MSYLWSRLLQARYALPSRLGRILPAPDAEAVLSLSAQLHRRGFGATLGYFQGDGDDAESVAEANIAALAAASREPGDLYLSIKAPALHFDEGLVGRVVAKAAAVGVHVLFDSHAPAQADRTLDLAEGLIADFPGTGCVLPARWHRSTADAARFRNLPARIRVVKGEWADAEADPADIRAAYLDLVSRLAGRSATVAIATHDPIIAEPALRALLAAGTPCEFEQLRGMPLAATTRIAQRLGVPVRVYLPFGPGWWPYAINKVLARPQLVMNILKDCVLPKPAFAARTADDRRFGPAR